MSEQLYDAQKNYRNLIGGLWKTSSSNRTIEVRSPLDDSLVGTVPAMTREEVDEAMEHSKRARRLWASTPIHQRAEYFYRAADILLAHTQEIAAVLMKEILKDKASAVSEVERSADFLRYTADIGKSLEGTAVSGENFPGGSRGKLSYVTHVPLGTVLAIAPFNYPVNLSMSKIAPALIGGNTVVLKPPSQGAISALYLAAVFAEAGLPAGVLNTVTGRGREIGDYLVCHPDVNFINFTGSTEIGRHIAEIAGMVPMMLELGGKDAAIVLDDCDLDFAAQNVVAGAFSYSGQRCTAVKRILVLEHVADRFVQKIRERMEQLICGNPDEEGVTVVPLINEQSVAFVQGLIDDALERGAALVMGNQTQRQLVYPTLLDHVTESMRIAWEEPFGPVLPVIRVHSIEEAVELANRSEYGLQASVFTRDISKAFRIAEQLEVGTVQINNKTERGPDHFPFLGVKSSGMGTQGVKYSIEAMMRHKAIVVNMDTPVE